MDIIFSINNNESVKVSPVPAEVEISEPQDNGEFDTLNGKLSYGTTIFPVDILFPKSFRRKSASGCIYGWMELCGMVRGVPKTKAANACHYHL